MDRQSKRINILYLITDLKNGGAQALLRNLLNKINRTRFNPSVACFYGGDSPIGDELRDMGITVTDLKMIHYLRFDALWRLYLLLRDESIIVLHGSLFHANITARLVGKIAKIPIIITWRHSISLGGKWRDWVKKLTSSLDDRVVAVSDNVMRAEIDTAGIAERNIEVIYNGIDVKNYYFQNQEICTRIRKELSVPEGSFLIGFVGRFHSVKGVNILLDAYSRVIREITDTKLIVVGDGEIRKQLELDADSFGVTQQVVFTGVRNDIPEILTALDILALPSYSEGFGLVLVEAMASGVPVVATNVGGIPEVVQDSETGILVNPGAPDELAAAILRLYNDQELRERLSRLGQECVESNFRIQETARKTEYLYLKLLKEKGIEL